MNDRVIHDCKHDSSCSAPEMTAGIGWWSQNTESGVSKAATKNDATKIGAASNQWRVFKRRKKNDNKGGEEWEHVDINQEDEEKEAEVEDAEDLDADVVIENWPNDEAAKVGEYESVEKADRRRSAEYHWSGDADQWSDGSGESYYRSGSGDRRRSGSRSHRSGGRGGRRHRSGPPEGDGRNWVNGGKLGENDDNKKKRKTFERGKRGNFIMHDGFLGREWGVHVPWHKMHKIGGNNVDIQVRMEDDECHDFLSRLPVGDVQHSMGFSFYDRQTDRNTNRQTDRQTDRKTQSDTLTDRQMPNIHHFLE